MIIDQSYFTGKLNLPQTGNNEGLLLVNEFIERYEPEYLQKVLGYNLWKAFSEGIDGSGEIEQRFIDLLEGKEFEYSGKTYKWVGFETKPIQNYVYYHFLDNAAYDTVQVGHSVGKLDNAIAVAPEVKAINAWNEMVLENHILYKFLQANKTTYPEWDSCQSSNEVYHRKNRFDL